MTKQQEERMRTARAAKWKARIARAQQKRKYKLAPHNVAGWEQVTTFLSQHAQVATATEKLTARQWLEEEYGRLSSKGFKCKIYQHPQAPDLIALYKECKAAPAAGERSADCGFRISGGGKKKEQS